MLNRLQVRTGEERGTAQPKPRFSEFLIPVLCSVVGDNEGGVEQNDDVVGDTQERHGM